MQDPGQFKLSDFVVAIIGGSYQQVRPACANLEMAGHFIRDWAKKTRQPVLVAAPCLFVQLAHLDGNYP